MYKNYTVSVCVPVFGVEKYIERCAVSLFEQTLADIEYIFVNDCTKDASIRILNTVLDRYPERRGDVKIIDHATNRGLAVTRNTGLEHCSGEFVLWVDSDDYIEKDAVEALLDTMRKHPSDMIFFNADMHSVGYRTLERFPENITKDDLLLGIIDKRIPPYLWRFLIRRSLYTAHDVRSVEGVDNGEDYLVLPQLLYYAKTVTPLDRVLYHYDNTRQDSLSRFSLRRMECEWKATLLLEDFLRDKGKRYTDAVNTAKLVRILGAIRDICKGMGTRKDFEKYRAMKNEAAPRYREKIPLGYKPLLLIDNFMLACLYVRSAVFVKICIRRLLRIPRNT